MKANCILDNVVFLLTNNSEAQHLSYVQLTKHVWGATIEKELQGHMTVMGIAIASTGDTVTVDFSFSVCSEDDTYKQEIGDSIALGRLVRNSGFEILGHGDIDPTEFVLTQANRMMDKMGEILRRRDVDLEAIEDIKIESYQNFSDEFNKLAGKPE